MKHNRPKSATASVWPGIHYATLRNEDTGEQTKLFIRTHQQVDQEIEQRLRCKQADNSALNAKRENWHRQIDINSSACRNRNPSPLVESAQPVFELNQPA